MYFMQNQLKFFSLPKSDSPLTTPHARPTPKDGDCAIHAMFGVLVGGEYRCSNIPQIKQLWRDLIIQMNNSDLKHNGSYRISKMRTVTKESIASLIMENSEIKTKSLIELRRAYHQQTRADYKLANDIWEMFSKQLEESKHTSVKNYIETTGQGMTLKEKFIHLLNHKKSELDQLIGRLEELNSYFCNYQALHTVKFDWDAHITKDVIRDYANLLTEPQRWLWYNELVMLALAFDLDVVFYAFPGAEPQILNEEAPAMPTVGIRFNGSNHYERVINVNRPLEKKVDKPVVEYEEVPVLQPFANMQALRNFLIDQQQQHQPLNVINASILKKIKKKFTAPRA